ncbi:ATP-dependent DNA ligase [Candidatus Pacearchaeota archaeon]|nr:MAG: ATP-dependent DNA ligase [Candidatus Pacearchaeota archaeon]
MAMLYSQLVEVYEKLSRHSSKIEKTHILADFLKELAKHGKKEWIYLLRGRVVSDYDTREIGISDKLAVKAIAFSFGIDEKEIFEEYKKVGDLGEIAEHFSTRKKQVSLLKQRLTIERVFNELRKLLEVEGSGSISLKIEIISSLLSSAEQKEAKYLVRTLLGDLRVGVGENILRDAIVEAFFKEDKSAAELVARAYELANDFAQVFEAAKRGKAELEKIEITPGRPVKVMLPVKVTSVAEAFKVCGKPAEIEHKYDGFRVVISKDSRGELKLFTRRLEDVTKQFPDVCKAVEKLVKGKSFILDSEVVGYDKKTKRYKPFEAISQRIKRKYEIKKLVEELPVEVNVFDVLYYNGKSVMKEPFKKRRALLEKIVKSKPLELKLAENIITADERVAERFYRDVLRAGEEGVIFKNLEAPYTPGRRVGNMVKLKPVVKDLDLVIVGAEFGSGKRAGWLTSYILACRHNDKFLEVGKVSSGLKEKEGEGTTYEEMTRLLKPLVKRSDGKFVEVAPKLVVSVTYQNIQKSPAYTSGFALRFPRITMYRPDRNTSDIATLDDIKQAYLAQFKRKKTTR